MESDDMLSPYMRSSVASTECPLSFASLEELQVPFFGELGMPEFRMDTNVAADDTPDNQEVIQEYNALEARTRVLNGLLIPHSGQTTEGARMISRKLHRMGMRAPWTTAFADTKVSLGQEES